MEEPVVFTCKGAWLSGVWCDSGKPRAPAVVFHHGFGGTRIEAHRLFVKCARRLALDGIDSFRFDFYGAGDSEGSLSDATLSVWIENSSAAAALAQSKKRNKIILLGFSLGGFAAAAAAPGIQPLGLCLWAPIFHPLKRMLRETEMVRQAREGGFADYQGEIVKASLLEDAAQFRIPNAYRGYSGPVCVIYATQDTSALARECRQWGRFYRAQGAPVHMHGIRGANHSFDRHDWENEVIEHTARWVSSLTT